MNEELKLAIGLLLMAVARLACHGEIRIGVTTLNRCGMHRRSR
jgi:hypothetical protein